MEIIQGNITVNFGKQDIQDALVLLVKQNGVLIDDNSTVSYELTAGRGSNPQHKAVLHIASGATVEESPKATTAAESKAEEVEEPKAKSKSVPKAEEEIASDSSLDDIFK